MPSDMLPKGADANEADRLLFHKQYLSSVEELESVKLHLIMDDFEKVRKFVGQGYCVDKGDLILSYSGLSYDKTLPAPNNSISDQDHKWVAARKGVLALEENTFKIIGPVQQALIQMSRDKMEVALCLEREMIDFVPTESLVKSVYGQMGFISPFPEEKVRAALDMFNSKGKDQKVILSRGSACLPGHDGRMELLLDLEPSLPNLDEAGQIDFRNFTFFRTVSKGEALAHIFPSEPGTVGMDVFGKPVMPPPVFSFGKKLGNNTQASDTKPAVVSATCNGKISSANGMPEVIDTLTIEGDVSTKTGNLNFPGAIDIKGDVRDNFQVNAKGDVEIAGVVEDGIVSSEGSIVVKGGFSGTGRGLIKSKLSSVTIGYIRNQSIESHSDIIIYNEAVNAQLLARKSIIMKTTTHPVVGGHLTAYVSIEVAITGSLANTKTILEVGKDFEVEREIEKKRSDLKEIVTDLEFLQNVGSMLRNFVRFAADVKPEQRLLEMRVQGMIDYLSKLKEETLEASMDLETRLFNPGDCFIHVREQVFPGTVLRHRDQVIIVTEAAKNKRWIFKGKNSQS